MLQQTGATCTRLLNWNQVVNDQVHEPHIRRPLQLNMGVKRPCTIAKTPMTRTCTLLFAASALGCRAASPVSDAGARAPVARHARLECHTGARAVVGDSVALFVFPSESRQSWPGADGERVPSASDRYGWGVTVLAVDSAYLISAGVAHADHPAPFGSLAAAVEASRPRLYGIARGGHVQVPDPAARVGRALLGNCVQLEVRGSDIRRVFRARPSEVRFGVLAPTTPNWRDFMVPVEYASP